MSLLKRTFTSILLKVDGIVGEMENHEALIQAAIGEQRRKISGAKLELSKIKKYEGKIREQVLHLEKNNELWTQRAIKEAGQNEEKALLCMQQREFATEQAEKLDKMRHEYATTSERMTQTIKQAEDEVRELIQRHQIMRARQSTADAIVKVGHVGSINLDYVENSFDRWEVNIAQGEYLLDFDADLDDLEQTYIKEENEQHLREQLSVLLRGEE